MAQTPDQVDVLILTALEQERQALLRLLPNNRMLDPVPDDNRRPYYAELPVKLPSGASGKYDAVIVRCGMGRVPATMVATKALLRWRPRYVILVGIAGGNVDQGVQIGDILIATSIVDYESKKLLTVTEKDGSKVMDPIDRWRVFDTGGRLLEASRDLRVENPVKKLKSKRPDAKSPKVHFGAVASGDKVISYKEAVIELCKHFRELKGIEMEAAGVAAAVFDHRPQPELLMIRGVSDLADEKKDGLDVKQWRDYACGIAAAFTLALLESGPLPFEELRHKRTSPRKSTSVKKAKQVRAKKERRSLGEPFDLRDVGTIAELLNATSLAGRNSRKKLCYATEVDPGQVSFLDLEGDSNFAHEFVHWLNKRIAVKSFNLLFDILEDNLGGVKKKAAEELSNKLSRYEG